MSRRDYELLRPHLVGVALAQHTILFTTDTKITRAYFPHDSVISLFVHLSDGETAAVGVVGRDGALGAAAVLGAPHALNHAIVQVPGSATAIDIDHLRDAAERSQSLREALFRCCHFKRAFAQQSAVCMAKHPIKARLCRLLMRMHYLTDRKEFPVTQESLALLLGVQRVSVALIEEQMQRAGDITYRRGLMQIINLEAVEAAACECYWAINEKRAILFESGLLAGIY
jgi:CRP-like cAMP-binding protein